MCFSEVAVKTKLNGQWGEEFFGIGGSEIVEKNKNGISPNDEGYKKATTDALGVAFKAVVNQHHEPALGASQQGGSH